MPQKFIKKEKDKEPGFNIGITLNKKPVKGDVGIEIEVEGTNLLHNEEVPLPWIYTVDHSLRGEENAEYVLGKPIPFNLVHDSLEVLFDKLKDKGAVFDDSNRTSVHVHLNVQDFHFNRLAAFVALWYAVEEVLTEWCGEFRVGNLFCLRGIDAPANVTHIKNFIRSNGTAEISEALRYGGLNPNALIKYGSLEIRTLQGCHDPSAIETWVSILERLHTMSKDFTDPRDAVAMFSSGGPLTYFNHLLGDKAQLVREAIGWSDADIFAAMQRGIRLAQAVVYCRDWGQYNPFEVKPDPFGRDIRKLAKKLASGSDNEPVSGANALPAFSSAPPVHYLSGVAAAVQAQAAQMLPTSDFETWLSYANQTQEAEAPSEPEPELESDPEYPPDIVVTW